MTARTIDELDLPRLPLEDPEFARNPIPVLAAARERHPWLAKTDHGLAVHGYQALLDMARLEDRMRPPHSRLVELVGAKGTRWGDFLENSVQALSGAEHKRLRDILAAAFTPRQANLYRDTMREVVSDLLDEWAPKGAFDFEEFASRFPVSVMCRLIGGPVEAMPSLRPALEALGQGFTVNPDTLPMLEDGYRVMDAFVRELIASRKSDPKPTSQPDLLDALLQANQDGGLTDQELSELLIFLFVAGYDTSKNALTLTFFKLLDHPDMYARCASDKKFAGQVIDEMFRYLGVATGAKLTVEDIEYDGVILPKDTLLFLLWSTAGRDQFAFANADEFDPEHARKNRLAFGAGPHICLGQFIAKAQLDEGLHLIAQRLKRPRLGGDFDWRPFIGVWGLRGLPIQFEIEPDAQPEIPV